MFQQYFGSRKTILLVLTGVLLLALLALTWRFVSLQKAASKAAASPVLKISYCGTEPRELCVLSFGRDAEENMVVNLFVPVRKFPDFYLKIKRVAGESIYKCEKDKEVRTSVFCYGDLINLQEKMEVSLFAKTDERLIAVGNFTLNAILISSAQAQGIQDTPTSTPTLTVDTETVTPTSGTPALTQETPAVTATFTPDPSYPNSSYP